MLWRRLDCPARLDYRIQCDSRWESRIADVMGWVGEKRIKLRLEKTPDGAWLMYPELELRPLVQRLRRESAFHFAYESDTGFSMKLEVDADGMIVDYPPFWREEKG